MAELARHGISADATGRKDVHLVYLAYPDLNGTLLGKQIDAMMQSEPQSSQAINGGFGVEVLKPYAAPIGEPLRTLVMTERFYGERRPLAEKFMRCFVQATSVFIAKPALAEDYVRGTMFKGQLSGADFRAAIVNARTRTTSRPATSRSRPTSWSAPAWAAWAARRWRRTGCAPICWPRPSAA